MGASGRKRASELKDRVHIPFELVVADAQEKLSAEGHSKIMLHINVCKECSEVFQLVKESLASEEKTVEQGGSGTNIPIKCT